MGHSNTKPSSKFARFNPVHLKRGISRRRSEGHELGKVSEFSFDLKSGNFQNQLSQNDSSSGISGGTHLSFLTDSSTNLPDDDSIVLQRTPSPRSDGITGIKIAIGTPTTDPGTGKVTHERKPRTRKLTVLDNVQNTGQIPITQPPPSPQSQSSVLHIEKAWSSLVVNESIRAADLDMIHNLVKYTNDPKGIFGKDSVLNHDCDGKRRVNNRGIISFGGEMPDGVGYVCRKGFKPESPNQDNFMVMKFDEWTIVGVFDGHGPNGHQISDFVRTTMPYLLLSDIDFGKDLKTCIRRAFRQTRSLIEAANMIHEIDATLSGTTVSLLFIKDREVTVAHVGDSRIVLGVLKHGTIIRVTDLTKDHKPQLGDERKRIERCGGEVKRLEGDIPFRVFIRGRHFPGLAMSRAMGDTLGGTVGVTSIPDISHWEVPNDEQWIVVVASDGIWEFIESHESIPIAMERLEKGTCQSAAVRLATEAWDRWTAEEDVVDDITCVVTCVNPVPTGEKYYVNFL